MIKYIKGDSKVERFRIKNVIYLTFIAIFMLIVTKTSSVYAQDSIVYHYDIAIEGLEYGDKYSDGEIVIKEQSEPGTFVIACPDDVVNQTGIIFIGVNFIPDNEGYPSEYFQVEVEIKAIDVIIVFDSLIYKQHDGSDVAILPGYSLDGIIHDSVSVEGKLEGRYETTLVSDNIPITLSGISLKGDYSGAYNLILTGHTGRIHPSYLQDVANRVTLDLDENVFISGNYNLNVKQEDDNHNIIDKYTSFSKTSFAVYDQTNRKIEIDGKYKATYKIDKEIMAKERLAIFELDENNNYKELEYIYSNGVLYFEIDTSSSVVFATRNIEYHYIALFSGILLFSLAISKSSLFLTI